MLFHDSLPWVVFLVTLVASILSGMVGGGGGFIITPFLIAIGLTPQQSIATGKLGALGLDAGSIKAFSGKVKANRNFVLFIIFLSILTGAASSYFIRHLKNENLQLVMGLLNLLMVPIVLIRHHKLKSKKRHYIFQGFGLAAIVAVMLLQGVFSSGVGSLINVFLILFFGFSALQASLIKRKGSIAADVVVLAGLFGSGLINYKYGLITAVAGLIGGYFGTKLAVHEGEKFARYALVILMVVSGAWLIATA